MPFYKRAARAANQETIGEQLYFFRSLAEPPNHTQCLVMAHGGYTMGTGRTGDAEGAGQFIVPAGITVHFYVPHGTTANNPSVQVHIMENHHSEILDVGPGQRCYNYRLSKVLGHGADVGSNLPLRYNRSVEDYMETYSNPRRAGEWAPNIVTVRNRFFESASVTLESLIQQVTTSHPGLTDFYILACRAVFKSGKMLQHESIKV